MNLEVGFLPMHPQSARVSMQQRLNKRTLLFVLPVLLQHGTAAEEQIISLQCPHHFLSY